MLDLGTAAYHMCERHKGMEHLRLQKSLYIAHMFYAGLNEAKKLIATNFYAWKYGPVSAELYQQLREYGRSPIPYKIVWRDVRVSEANDEDIEFLDFISDMIRDSELTTVGLMNYTHQKGSAWDKLRKKSKGYNVVISEESLAEEYKERYSSAK